MITNIKHNDLLSKVSDVNLNDLGLIYKVCNVKLNVVGLGLLNLKVQIVAISTQILQYDTIFVIGGVDPYPLRSLFVNSTYTAIQHFGC